MFKKKLSILLLFFLSLFYLSKCLHHLSCYFRPETENSPLFLFAVLQNGRSFITGLILHLAARSWCCNQGHCSLAKKSFSGFLAFAHQPGPAKSTVISHRSPLSHCVQPHWLFSSSVTPKSFFGPAGSSSSYTARSSSFKSHLKWNFLIETFMDHLLQNCSLPR